MGEVTPRQLAFGLASGGRLGSAADVRLRSTSASWAGSLVQVRGMPPAALPAGTSALAGAAPAVASVHTGEHGRDSRGVPGRLTVAVRDLGGAAHIKWTRRIPPTMCVASTRYAPRLGPGAAHTLWTRRTSWGMCVGYGRCAWPAAP